METVYYYDRESRCCPVKEYLKQYLLSEKDAGSTKKRKQKILADIDAKIQHVENNQGRPTPPISKPLHGYSCFEILNPKDAKTVIRILYFRHQEKIVLLHAFEKPSSYKTTREKKNVDKQNEIGEKYLNIFKLTSENYEKYQ
jgi:phage-related protein